MIYEYVKAHPEEFKDVDILIQMRYLKEVLTNRAGSAPNKAATEKVIKETCLMPYTDMWITPGGKLGICCCDNFEVTDVGDLTKMCIRDRNISAYNLKYLIFYTFEFGAGLSGPESCLLYTSRCV